MAEPVLLGLPEPQLFLTLTTLVTIPLEENRVASDAREQFGQKVPRQGEAH